MARILGHARLGKATEEYFEQPVLFAYRTPHRGLANPLREPADGVLRVGDTAVASFSWDIEYEMQKKVSRENGRDIFVFARARGTWRAVWRTMLLDPPQ